MPCIVGKGGNGRAGTGLGMACLESEGQVGMKQAVSGVGEAAEGLVEEGP